MKKLICLSFTLLIPFTVLAQKKEEDLSAKLKRAQSQKASGISMTVAGIGLTVAGMVVYINGLNESDAFTNSYNRYDDNSDGGAGKIIGGLVVMIAGEALLATGITFWIVGGVKSGRYQRLIKQQEKKVSLKLDHRGIGLQFNF